MAFLGSKTSTPAPLLAGVRELGTVLCVFGPEDDEALLKARLQNLTSPELEDLVEEVSIDAPVVLNPGALDDLNRPLPRLGALDCGIKYNILRNLCEHFEVVWCPPSTSFEILTESYNIDALFCSNGPGRPGSPRLKPRWQETPLPPLFVQRCP